MLTNFKKTIIHYHKKRNARKEKAVKNGLSTQRLHHNGYTEGGQSRKTAQETSLWHFLIPEHLTSQPPFILVHNFLMEISMERIGTTPQPLSSQHGMLWDAAPASPESSAPWHPPRPRETRAPVGSNPWDTWAQKPKHAQTGAAPKIISQTNSNAFSQKQLPASFQILLFPQILDHDTITENTTACLKGLGLIFFNHFLNMRQTKQFSHSCF